MLQSQTKARYGGDDRKSKHNTFLALHLCYEGVMSFGVDISDSCDDVTFTYFVIRSNCSINFSLCMLCLLLI